MNVAVTVICAILALTSVGFPIGAIIAGKVRLRRALQPVEYYPPRGYSPIDVLAEYYGFRANTHSLLNPLMLYWADRGYITIEEDCKRGLKLTKLHDLERDDGNRINEMLEDSETLFFRDRNFDAEKALFDGIFANGDVFYTLAAGKSYLDGNKEFIGKCKENARTLKTPATKKLSRGAFLYSVLATVVGTIAVAASSGGGPLFLCMLFPIIAMIMIHVMPIEEMPGTFKALIYPFFAVWGGAPFCVPIALLPWQYSAPLALVVVASALSVVMLVNRIDIRAAKHIAIYGQIKAFKTFLTDAEADRINTLVEENPNYYYDVLPYCYILKITDKLQAKFDRIALDGPSWYLGELRDTLMF